jgi:hypothetical protein
MDGPPTPGLAHAKPPSQTRKCIVGRSVILATQEAEIRRIRVQSQPRANSLRDPISVAQGVGPEFKPQYCKKKKKKSHIPSSPSLNNRMRQKEMKRSLSSMFICSFMFLHWNFLSLVE